MQKETSAFDADEWLAHREYTRRLKAEYARLLRLARNGDQRSEVGLLCKADQEIEALRQQFASGNKGALLSTVYKCLAHSRPFPPWAVNAFIEVYGRATFTFEYASWDEAFGRPPTKGRKHSAAKRRQEIAWKVYRRVRALRARRPKPRDIFHIVGCEFKISAATVKRYFDACTAEGAPWTEEEANSRLWAQECFDDMDDEGLSDVVRSAEDVAAELSEIAQRLRRIDGANEVEHLANEVERLANEVVRQAYESVQKLGR
jgi:hypothetical protein